MMAAITIISLAIVAALCAIGALYKHYDDNLLQRLGMAGICLANIGLMVQVAQVRGVNHACGMLAVSLAIFALGVAAKVLKFRPRGWSDTEPQDRNEVHP